MVSRTIGEFTVNAAPGDAGFQTSVAGSADGHFFVAWTASATANDPNLGTFESYDIFGRGFAGAMPLGGDVVVNTERRDGQISPSVAARNGGSYVIAYSSGDENNLPGTFIGSQVIANDGSKVGAEQLGDYSMYHLGPDVAVTSANVAVIVSGEEERGEVQIRSPGNQVLGVALYGANGQPPQVAVTVLPDDSRVLLYTGYADRTQDGDTVGPFGLYALTQPAGSPAGAGGSPFLVTAGAVSAPSARATAAGAVAISWAAAGPSGVDIFASVVSPAGASVVAPFVVNQAVAGNQIAPALAVLGNGDIVVTWQDNGDGDGDGDGDGSGILARVFHADGTPASDAFVVDQQTAGDQHAPSVAALGSDAFVIAWDGPAGIEASIFADAPAAAPMLFARPGTIDLSPAANQTVAGSAGPNSIVVDLAAMSGADRVTNFGKDDVLLTSAKLYDSNNDGIVVFGKNGVLDLDGPRGSTDTIRFDGVKSLRYLGMEEGRAVYADASVRPLRGIEGTLATETLRGDTGDHRADTIFRDTALGASFGDDHIVLGTKDIFVTTTAITGVNRPDGSFDLGPDHVTFATEAGATAQIEFDGSVQRNGVSYFVYSLIGSAAGTDQLHFA